MKVVKFVARVDEVKCSEAKTGKERCAPLNAPYCQATCPLHIDVRSYVSLIREGKFDDALKLISEQVPFSGTLGRVCPHPCESTCERAEIDEPIAINDLKRSTYDHGKAEKQGLSATKRKQKSSYSWRGSSWIVRSVLPGERRIPNDSI